MGQGERGDAGPQGPKGDPGNPGVGIQFVTWNSTTGQMLITKTDNTQLPPLEVKGIQGPMGPPGTYDETQLANAVITRGGGSFISSVSANLATQQQLSTNLATELSKENLYPLFKSKVSDNLSANNQFKQSISDNLKRDDGFKGYVSNELGTLVSTDIGKLVSTRTIWCNDNICSLPTTGTLNIPTGYNWSGESGTGQPITFSQKENGGFKHFIRTKHKSGESPANAFDFYVNTGTDSNASSSPGTGNKHIMSIHGQGVNINGQLKVGGGDSNSISGVGESGPLVIDPNFTNNSYVKIYDGLQIEGDLNATGDFVFNGNSNKWILHTPDENNRTDLFIAPRKSDNNDWDWGKQTKFLKNGGLEVNGDLNTTGDIKNGNRYFRIAGGGANCNEMQAALKNPGDLIFAGAVDSAAESGLWVAGMNQNRSTYCKKW